MNTEQLISFIENKEHFDQKAISQIMLLIEKYPYFQTAHMLLLKALHKSQLEKYNGQLKISGSFISDKRRLFEFINENKVTVAPKKEEVKQEEDLTEKKTKGFVRKSLIRNPIEKTEEKVITEREKRDLDKKEKTPVTKNIEKKIDLPEGEIEKQADKNSKTRHTEIIKDFFHDSGKQKVEKKVIETKPKTKETDKKVVEGSTLEQRIAEAERKDHAKKEAENKKIISIKKEPELKKKEEGLNIKEGGPIKKTIEPEKKTTDQTETMTNIFSKIRQIKKEMNLSTEVSNEVNVKPKDEKSIIESSSSTTEEKKTRSGKIIKESYIGFKEEEQDKKEPAIELTNKAEDPQLEKKEEISETGLTAKDLFKQHRMKKENIDSGLEQKRTETVTPERTKTESPISKIVKTINTDVQKDYKNDDFIDISKKEIKDNNSLISEKKEEIPQTTGSLSAADALIQRIAAKKQKMREEREKEEREKLLRSQKPVIETKTPEKEEKVEPIIEHKEEKIEPIVEHNEEKKVELTNLVNEETTKTEITKPENKNPNKLIDNFIEKIESFDRIGSKEPSLSGDISESSSIEKEEFMTETMADLLIQQKNYQKAIDVYKKLILKFPEKKTYFAIQIKKVESLIK